MVQTVSSVQTDARNEFYSHLRSLWDKEAMFRAQFNESLVPGNLAANQLKALEDWYENLCTQYDRIWKMLSDNEQATINNIIAEVEKLSGGYCFATSTNIGSVEGYKIRAQLKLFARSLYGYMTQYELTGRRIHRQVYDNVVDEEEAESL